MACSIPVAESVDGELAAAEGFEKCAVVAKGPKCADPAPAPLSRLSKAPDQFLPCGVFLGAGEGIQVPPGRLTGNLGAGRQILHWPPQEFRFRQ